ncbi:unnamed protein product [Spirodela intermedia]|uniref:DYW domain-containing protein n=1 Tax=Spirodela intermedia TaxID=51605 RepID=A0A7I8INN5_SPIIN|nr:unnamed protein product [Spirodela intermedia]CAA6659063.1 unnamed protein product [Spirodela intermedia]
MVLFAQRWPAASPAAVSPHRISPAILPPTAAAWGRPSNRIGAAGVAGRGSRLAVFERAKNRTTFLWNSMIHSCCRLSSPELAVAFYGRMMKEGRRTNFFTYPSLISACSNLATACEGSQVHSHAMKMGFESDRFLRSSLIHMYSSFGDMGSARILFDELPLRNVVVWTALINGYAKQGDLEKAKQVFDRIPERDSVIWSAMVSGHVQNGKFSEGLSFFQEMISEGVEATEGAMVSALSACAHLGALQLGRWIHSYLEKKKNKKPGQSMGINLGTALVDMYAKCGAMAAALDVFEAMPSRNDWTWNAMMGAFSCTGMAEAPPVTFLGLLGAFSHGGMVEEGKEFFKSMSSFFSMEPSLEHYACLVDLLARAGCLQEAQQVVGDMPIEPDAGVWGALLGGCRVHGDVGLGTAVGRRLLRFDQGGAGRYVLLSNIYAAARRWEDAGRVRALMAARGVKPQAGISSVEIDGVVHEFVSGDRGHPLVAEIYKKMEEMAERLRGRGHCAATGEALLDLDEEDKELQLASHSERLAIAFGLIALPIGAPIRVVKNLRVCADCHAVTKLLSEIYQREIIVRDRKRFHHFKDGSCSCSDYW